MASALRTQRGGDAAKGSLPQAWTGAPALLSQLSQKWALWEGDQTQRPDPWSWYFSTCNLE